MSGELPEDWEKHLPSFEEAEAMATRVASGKVINALAPHMPMLIGGSADLGVSNNTDIKDGGSFEAGDRKSTRLNSSHGYISYAVFCLKKKKRSRLTMQPTRSPDDIFRQPESAWNADEPIQHHQYIRKNRSKHAKPHRANRQRIEHIAV